MDVSIIIINFNSSKYTNDCVDSIHRHTAGLEFEIIVVDNNSELDDANALETLLENKNASSINSKSNLGFGGGNLLGYQFATGDYLAFINNDAVLTENSLLKLFNYIKSEEQVGVLELRQMREENERFEYSARQFIGLKHHFFGNASSQAFYGKNMVQKTSISLMRLIWCPALSCFLMQRNSKTSAASIPIYFCFTKRWIYVSG